MKLMTVLMQAPAGGPDGDYRRRRGADLSVYPGRALPAFRLAPLSLRADRRLAGVRASDPRTRGGHSSLAACASKCSSAERKDDAAGSESLNAV